ncbi:MAG: hypothetical protein LBN12_04855 [Clostridiales Family XIII bacterium]|jgi:curved DNA-binding protein CbpA|nr:hypothetical protein [Clostridiales Family XIII bacterium]
MTDYYVELELQSSAGLDEIKRELSSQKLVYEARYLSSPEAKAKFELVEAAEKVFSDEGSRRAYDEELAESKRTPETEDPDAERRAEYEKWFAEAKQYFSQDKNDLARSAIDKALQYKPQKENVPELYEWAADIYQWNKEYRTALSYINEAIVLDPGNPASFLVKVQIYQNSDDPSLNIPFAEKTALLEAALEKANERDILSSKWQALDFLAGHWYFDSPGHTHADAATGEKYAHEALALKDDAMKSKRVLDAIARKAREADQEAARRAEEQRQQAENAKRQAENAKRQAENRAHNAEIQKQIDVLSGQLSALERKRAAQGEKSGIGCLVGAVVVMLIVAAVLLFNSIGAKVLVEYFDVDATGGMQFLILPMIIIGIVLIVVSLFLFRTIGKRRKIRAGVSPIDAQIAGVRQHIDALLRQRR